MAMLIRAQALLRGGVRTLHASAASFKLVPIVVPAMGDSIVDGTLNSLVPVGTRVKVDDVVATIETDKVTFEVRTPEAGVISEVKAAANDTVAVGAPLFTIDTEGVATAAPAAGASAPAPAPPKAAAAPPAAAATGASAPSTAAAAAAAGTGSHHRTPSIHFRYGKREAPAPPSSHAHGAAGRAPPTSAPTTAAGHRVMVTYANYDAFLAARFGASKATKTFLDIAPQFGRPPLGAAESAAIESGGAY